MTVTTGVAVDRMSRPAAPGSPTHYAGLVTRLVAFVIDAALIDLVAMLVALAAALIGALFHFPKDLHTVWVVLGVTAYALWAAGYFIVFWSTTGQTPGARVMQIRVVAVSGGPPKPIGALVRAIGVVLATLPLCIGFIPVLFDDRRRALQDYLARTAVESSPQLSLAHVKRDRMRARRFTSPRRVSSA